jgi:hypothetical protein
MTADITPEAIAALLDGSLDISHPFIDEPALRDALTAAEARIAELEDALRLYGEADLHISFEGEDSTITTDGGKRARAALEKKP